MKIKILRLCKDLPVPHYKHAGDSGMDLYSAENKTINSLSRELINCGIKLEIPLGYEIQIRPRSGLAIKQGLTVLNTPGTIDSCYRGEIAVIIFNTNKDKEVEIKKGDRIAQMVLQKVEYIELEEAETITDTTRQEGGFGSTGEK